MYASPAWRGFVTATDLKRVDAFLRRCKRFGYCSSDLPAFEELLDESDDQLFSKTLNNTHSHTPYTSPSTVLSIAVLPFETTHARQTAANTKQSPVHKKLRYTRAV